MSTPLKETRGRPRTESKYGWEYVEPGEQKGFYLDQHRKETIRSSINYHRKKNRSQKWTTRTIDGVYYVVRVL